MTTTVSQLYASVRAIVAPLGTEGRWCARLIMEAALDKPYSWLLTYGDRPVEPSAAARATGWASRVIGGEPVQYVTGIDSFHGLKLHVTPDVLIPRPETAILVDMIVADAGSRPDLRVLDVGTGSGAIALALAASLTFPQVTGIDISSAALDVARANACSLKLRNVAFCQADALALSLPGPWDIIASNPPYVLESERAAMESRVLDHEPWSALFVPDSSPLEFYEPIARYAASTLNPGGKLYFECNPLSIDLLQSRMKAMDAWSDIETFRDDRGAMRFLKAVKS